MGWFSDLFNDSYDVQGSYIYNLAGDTKTRPNYLRTLVIQYILSKSKQSIGDVLVKGYLGGPGINLKNFARWARVSGYQNTVGQVSSALGSAGTINNTVLAGQLPTVPGWQVVIERSNMGSADYTFWADALMLQHHPELIDTAYRSSFQESTNILTLYLEGQSDGQGKAYHLSDYDKDGFYIYAVYNLTKFNSVGEYVIGSVVKLTASEPFPDTQGWVDVIYDSTERKYPLYKSTVITKSYSDGRPDEVTTSKVLVQEIDHVDIQGVFRKDRNEGNNGSGALVNTMLTQNITQKAILGTVVSTETSTEEIIIDPPEVEPPEEPEEGEEPVEPIEPEEPVVIVVTTKVVTTTDTYKLDKYYRLDSQVDTLIETTPLKTFIYKRGGNNAVLNQMFNTGSSDSYSGYYPYIPIRMDNRFISPSYQPAVYNSAKKAVKKSIKGDLDKLISDLQSNKEIGNMNWIYLTFGVSANTAEKAGQRYIYEFLRRQVLVTGDNGTAYARYRELFDDYNAKLLRYQRNRWSVCLQDECPPMPDLGPVPPQPMIPQKEIRITSDRLPGANINYSIYWNSLREGVGSGLGRPGAKKGDFWFVDMGNDSYNFYLFEYQEGYIQRITSLRSTTHPDRGRFYWQDSANTFRYIETYGLGFFNRISSRGISADQWAGGVYTSARAASQSTEESPFIFPLHEDIYNRLPITGTTQMCSASSYMVINYKKRITVSWWKSSFFKFLLISVVVTISAISFGGGAAAGGILGSNVAVGTAIGFAGTAALVAGAVANAVAAMIILQVLTSGATALFGDKFGAIIGAVATIFAIQAGNIYMTEGASMTSAYSNLFRADKLIQLTNSVGNVYADIINKSTQNLVMETQGTLSAYNDQMDEITKLYKENLGNGLDVFNPTSLTDSGNTPIAESMDVFLNRTLMTGTDIAEMSHSLIDNFAGYTTSVELNT